MELKSFGHAWPAGGTIVPAHRVAHRLESNVDAYVVSTSARLELEHVAPLAARQVEYVAPGPQVLPDQHRLDPVVQVPKVQDVGASGERAVAVVQLIVVSGDVCWLILLEPQPALPLAPLFALPALLELCREAARRHRALRREKDVMGSLRPTHTYTLLLVVI
eukprot:scaffold200515_cov33-Tisochrysis_lutea.AAC.2